MTKVAVARSEARRGPRDLPLSPVQNLLVANFISTRHLSDRWGEFFSAVKDKQQCAQIQSSLNSTRELLRMEPCLVYDFQALMDRNGNMYHLDFERRLLQT